MTKFYLFVKRVLPVLILASCCTMALAQGRTVSGKVTSADDGSGVPGVNILEKGTGNGTVSDADGNYRISVGANATLVFSFVGYTTQEAAVGDQSVVNVALASDVTALSEVVVVGYGSQEKKEITSAVVSVKSESFNRGAVQDPTQLILGKVAGVAITRTGNDPNEPFTVRMRGITTVGANQQPLFVIDGVIGASMANVDPNDIQSIDVLKDGSAAAIYGTQGSSGVILVTTKKGKAGKPVIDYNTYVASESIAKSVSVMDRNQYLAVGGTDLGANTNWLKEVTQAGHTVVNNLGISGGSGNTTYRMSLNVRDVQGILKNSGFDQINGRISLQQSALDNKLRLSVDASTTTRNSNYSFQEALRYATIYNPTAPVYAPSGANSVTGSQYQETSLFDNYNPVGIINQNVSNGKKVTMNLSGKAELDILPGLTATATYALQRENEITGEYYSKTAYFRGFNRNGFARRFSNQAERNIFEGYLTYTKQMDNLHMAIVGGYSYQERSSQGFGVQTGNFLSDALGYNSLGNSQDIQKGNGLPAMSSYASPDQKLLGMFLRANFNYNETYLLSASYRREGSSGFGVNNKFGNFGAVSGAVMLNKLFEIPQVSTLKLRAGWGLTGALPPTYGISQIQYGQFRSDGTAFGYGYSNGNLIPIVSTTLAPNPNLRWEQKTEVNAGLDFGFMNNRFQGSFDVYQRVAKDFILQRPIDASINVAALQYQNLGEIKSTGVELALSYAVIQKSNMTWTTTLVASHVKSTLVALYPGTDTAEGLPELGSSLGAPGQNSTYTIRNIAGQQVGTMIGPVYQGVDASGNPILSTSQNNVLGHGLPTLDLGWTNNFTYKNWDLNFFLRGTFGHQIINSYRAFYEPVVGGQISSYNRVNTKFFDPNLKNTQWSSLYVENGDFVKLDNLTIGYNFRFNPGSAISKLRVYAGGNNLFVITGYTGTDPEARLVDTGATDNGAFNPVNADGTRQTNPLAPGIDRRNNFYRSRTVSLGVNVTF